MTAAPARPSPAAVLYAERKAASECLWCGIPAAPDSAYCCVHRDITRRQKAAHAKRVKDVRRTNGMCADCGRRKSKTRYCNECRPRRGVDNGVDKIELPARSNRKPKTSAAVDLVPENDGYIRKRYRGRDKGPPTRMETDEWDIRIIEAEMSHTRSDMIRYWSAENQAMPRIQRDASKRSALGHLELAQRVIDDLVERTAKGIR